MIEEPVLRKLLPLPYVPGEWQLTALRWWVKLRIPVFALAALILIPVANTLFWIVYFALPTALQLLTAMLVLYGFFLFTYYALRIYDDLLVYLVLGSVYAQAIPAAGIYPDVTRVIPPVLALVALGLVLPEFLRDLWAGVQRQLA